MTNLNPNNEYTRPYIKLLGTMKKKISKAQRKIQNDVRNHKSRNTIQRDATELMLLLGECNYIASECRRLSRKAS